MGRSRASAPNGRCDADGAARPARDAARKRLDRGVERQQEHGCVADIQYPRLPKPTETLLRVQGVESLNELVSVVVRFPRYGRLLTPTCSDAVVHLRRVWYVSR